MPPLVRDFNCEDPHDAERLAALFNTFDSAWPGGFTRGLPETGERMQERMRRSRHAAVLVAQAEDGDFVGYCDLETQAGQNEVAYIGLLGARPDVHGKGVGKALLREMVRRVTEKGYRELTLHTWPGNEKAMPLYKKIGFHWVADTTVFMRNFIPSALAIPAGKAFFAQRDWYLCHERTLEIAPDDVKWRGMKVYPYRFRDGDDFLNLTFSADCGGLTALETPAYAIACTISTEEAPAGETVPVTWEITIRDGRPREVVLLAEAEPGLEMRVQERLRVKDQATLTRDLRVSPDAAPRRGREPAHRIRSTLLIEGQPVVLETGVPVVRPVEIDYGGQGLFPGREEKITVRLRSHLDRPLAGTLALDAHPALVCEPPAQPFMLPARSWTQCEFALTAHHAGVYHTRLRTTAGDTRGGRSVAFRAFGDGSALASIDPVDDEQATLQSPNLSVEIDLRGGELRIRRPDLDRGFLSLDMGQLGPPFGGGRMRPPLLAAQTESTPHGTALTLTMPSHDFPGLVVERSVTIVSGDLVRLDYRVRNTTDAAVPMKLRLHTNAHLHGTLTLPGPDGLIREPLRSWGDYPQGDIDALPLGAAFSETWAAADQDGLTCGLIWQPGPELDMQWSHFPNLTYPLGELAPHSVHSLSPIYLVASAGDWEMVRAVWRRLVQPSGVHEGHKPTPVRVLEIRAEPSPVVMQDEELVRFVVRNRRGKSISGSLTLHGSDFHPETPPLALENLDRDRPFAVTVPVHAPNTPAAGFLKADLNLGPTTETFSLPIARLGAGDALHVSNAEDEQIVVENGHLTLRVAPHFRGALTHLERDGVNHLFTAYPEPRPFTWTNPWYGGVHPVLHWNHGDETLARETFTGAPTERVGERGLRWQGVRVACEMTHKDWRWLRLEIQYLTLPGSNVVALVSRWTNRTDARMKTGSGIMAWMQVGGTREQAVVHWERNKERRHRRRGGFAMWAESGPWTAVENAATGDLLALIASGPDYKTGLEDRGEEGPHIGAQTALEFAPNETQERLAWLVLCRDLNQLDAYAALFAQTERLP